MSYLCSNKYKCLMEHQITQKLEEIKVAIENSDNNSFITVWMPIIVVLVGAFIAYAVSQIEKNRQRKNLKHTIVLWILESIQPIEAFICSLQGFVHASQTASVLESKRLHIPTFDLQRINEFPIDKMSDALVARLKVGKNEKRTLIPIFYDLYDFTKNITNTHSQIIEAHSDYNRKMDYLSREWDEHFAEFSYQTKAYLLSQDATDSERQFFNQVQSYILNLWNQIAEAGGIFRRDILQDFIHRMSDAYTQTVPTQRIIETNKGFNRIRVVVHNMEGLHSDMIKNYQTIIGILSPSRDHLSGIVSFYEQHKIKCIFSLSNKVTQTRARNSPAG